MLNQLPSLEDLPKQNASHVKNKWGEVVRQVRQVGSVAVTHHSSIEMVLLDAGTYRNLVQQLHAHKFSEHAALDALNARFNARLESLQQPDAVLKLESLFESRGKMARPPKAGASF